MASGAMSRGGAPRKAAKPVAGAAGLKSSGRYCSADLTWARLFEPVVREVDQSGRAFDPSHGLKQVVAKVLVISSEVIGHIGHWAEVMFLDEKVITLILGERVVGLDGAKSRDVVAIAR